MSRNYASGVEVPSYSDLRLFSRCPRLWYEKNVLKTYEEPDQDYFIYGQLVDTILTEPEKLNERFVLVKKRVSPGRSLELVGEVHKLREEVTETELALAEKPNKTKAKGLLTKKKKLLELEADMRAVRSSEGKCQVTGSIWKGAHETAASMMENPMWAYLHEAKLGNRLLTQLPIESKKMNYKGTLDFLVLPEVLVFAIRSKKVDRKELRRLAAEEQAKVEGPIGGIYDAKTTYMLPKFEPENYAAQLAGYQDLVFSLIGLNLPCFLLTGDKESDQKMTQDYVASEETLMNARRKLYAVKEQFEAAFRDDEFIPAKILDGKDQTCFTCSMCRQRPYSYNAPAIF